MDVLLAFQGKLRIARKLGSAPILVQKAHQHNGLKTFIRSSSSFIVRACSSTIPIAPKVVENRKRVCTDFGAKSSSAQWLEDLYPL
jgi:hypothetical protein